MSASYPDPLIFLGYVVTDPHAARRKLLLFASDAHEQAEPPLPTAAPYDIMVRDGRVHDIDKDDLDRWCEYIFYRGLYRTAYARISRGSITDTELQVGQFSVPRYGKTTGEVSEPDRYLRARREELPTEHVRTSPPVLVPRTNSPFHAILTGLILSHGRIVVPRCILWQRKSRWRPRSFLSCL